MRVRYEPVKDILTLTLQDDAPIADVAEDVGGTVFGYDERGDLVVIEIVDATLNVAKLRDIERMLDRVTERILRNGDAD